MINPPTINPPTNAPLNQLLPWHHLIRGLSLFITAMLLSSCVEGEEEIWIKADGSGRVIAHYEIPLVALSQMTDPEDMIRALRLVDEKEEGLCIHELSFKKNRGKAIFHFEASFHDARELLDISARNEALFAEETSADPEQMTAVAGEIDFTIKGLTPTFSRSISLIGMFPPIVTKRPTMLGPSRFKYTMHLPAKVKESNAHAISADGRSVSWTFFLKDHLEEEMEMSFTTELPLPWWAWLCLALFAFLLAWFIWRKVLSSKCPSRQHGS